MPASAAAAATAVGNAPFSGLNRWYSDTSHFVIYHLL